MKNIVIVSGYFNPLHRGHIEYFHKAKQQGVFLVVIINNDVQRSLKKSKEFMDDKERALIVNELEVVDEVFISIGAELVYTNPVFSGGKVVEGRDVK